MKKIILFFAVVIFSGLMPDSAHPAEKEALFYHKMTETTLQCDLCPHKCVLSDKQRGLCRVRLNKKGILYTQVFGNPCSVNVDPIEKAPFYHFLPGSKRLCIATAGCNMRCSFCQNWQISQNKPEDISSYDLPPELVAQKAKEMDIPTVCFTYSEPIIFYEYMAATSQICQKQNIRTAMVSNGFINKEPLEQLLPYIDAVKIDLKAFSTAFYEDICMGNLDDVLKTLLLLKESGKHFEIVVLIIPTLNDSTDELQNMCSWIYKNLGADIPLHFTRFIPAYKLTSLPMTPMKTLEKAYDIAKKNLLYFVYIGNVPGHKYNSTYCPHCEKRLIYRTGYEIKENLIVKGKCPFCSEKIPGVWE